MYKIFKFDSMKAVFPSMCQPVATFAKLDHAIEYAENHVDANVTYITAFSEQNTIHGKPVLYFPANSSNAFHTEHFSQLVPFWEGGQAYK